ncbi:MULTISPECIES: Uma2 family endonuclease [Streptomyces]|uniref:Uma2 family endonuclease n=1 Tax=Streptomyces evansiae TaxID=3075535 RepID=A0ABU2R4B9_9ACTN|nr:MULTISPECIES: Uma2 family endonuclease [unclassified Streptomyces]MDT0411548.1 Uma2 family endonuclease [Streptomyces sp. DSM 41979]MYQ61598.1 Uma2 family endonuclease [Streptomyces sp. SID4926]
MAELAGSSLPAPSVDAAFEVFSAAAPKGWRVELVEGEIHVAPPAHGEHEEMVSELSGQARDHRRDLARYTGIGLRVPDTGIGLRVPGASGSGRVIPDLVLAPRGSFADRQEWHDPSPVLLAAEVTSPSTAANDRVRKIRGYARAGIPIYLVVDREAAHIVVCTRPSGDDYRQKTTYKVGDPVPLPEPVGFTLDSGQL